MCTVVILRRPGHRWPLLLAANRDEQAGRPWAPPSRHWPDRDDVTAGLDRLAGGSWLGVNDTGVIAGMLNRRDSLGPDPLLRSRGELPLEALDHAEAKDAAEALAALDGRAWRSFNMVIADNCDAYWLKNLGSEGAGRIAVTEIPAGLSMLTALELNDLTSPRIAHFLPLFEAAPAPDPDHGETGEWGAWQALLASQDHGPGAGPGDAMYIQADSGFGTLSTSLIGLAAPETSNAHKIWLFCPAPLDQGGFQRVYF